MERFNSINEVLGGSCGLALGASGQGEDSGKSSPFVPVIELNHGHFREIVWSKSRPR